MNRSRAAAFGAGTKNARFGLLLRVLFSVVVAGCLVIMVLAVTGLPNRAQWQWLASAEHLTLATSVALAVMTAILLRGLRWVALLPPQSGIGPARLLAGFGWSFLVLQALPFRSGELYRPLWLKLRGGSAAQATAAIVVERLVDTLMLGFLLVGSLLALPMLQGFVGPGAATVLVLGATVSLAAAAVAARRSGALSRMAGTGRFARIVEAALSGLSTSLAPQRVMAVAALSTLIWAVTAAAFGLFLSGTVGVPWAVGVGVLVLVNLTAVVPVAPGNMGVFEAVAVAALAASGVPAESALVAVVGLHMAVLAGIAVAGLVCRLALLLQEGC